MALNDVNTNKQDDASVTVSFSGFLETEWYSGVAEMESIALSDTETVQFVFLKIRKKKFFSLSIYLKNYLIMSTVLD